MTYYDYDKLPEFTYEEIKEIFFSMLKTDKGNVFYINANTSADEIVAWCIEHLNFTYKIFFSFIFIENDDDALMYKMRFG